MEDDKYYIIRDTREKPEFGYRFEEDEFCAGTIVRKLDVGDYSIENFEKQIAIERKQSVSEIANNYTEDRFWREVEKLAQMDYPFFVFEFNWNDIAGYPNNLKMSSIVKARIKIKPAFIFSKTLSLTIDYGIPVYFCGNRMGAERATYDILKRVYKKCNA